MLAVTLPILLNPRRRCNCVPEHRSVLDYLVRGLHGDPEDLGFVVGAVVDVMVRGWRWAQPTSASCLDAAQLEATNTCCKESRLQKMQWQLLLM